MSEENTLFPTYVRIRFEHVDYTLINIVNIDYTLINI